MLRRLLADRSGSAMLEFAIVLPVMALVYLGGYELSDMISCNRKFGIAARSLTDLASRSLSPTSIVASPSGTSGTAYMSAAAITLTPYSQANATEQMALLRVCDATHAYVIWSAAQTQSSTGTATSITPSLTAGTLTSASVVTIPTGMITTPMIPTSPDGTDVCSNFGTSTSTNYQAGTVGGFLFYGQVAYSYTSLPKYILTSTIPMGYIFYMSPRTN